MNVPKLSFIYAYPLDRGRREFFASKGINYPSMEVIKATLHQWEDLWTETNDRENIIFHLSEITGRIPERNLECFVFGAGLQAMSTPFLLPIWNKSGELWSNEKFIDIVIHELLHIFLVTNNDRYKEHLVQKFTDEEPLTQNHVFLYAMLYELYQVIFKKEPIDFGRDNLPPGYARAVELVREIGYKELITVYRSLI